VQLKGLALRARLAATSRARRASVALVAALACSCASGPGANASGATSPASTASGGAPGAASTSSGEVAADFTARDVDGNTFRLADHLGKEVVLLSFWSTFCEPCKAEFPHLRALYAANRARGLIVVGVAMDGPESIAEVPAFVKRYRVEFPVVLDEDSRIASLYDPKKSMPFSVLIGRDQRTAAVREGYSPGDEKFVAADVTKALDEAGPAR
jgi:peroxiredoxin